MRRMAIWAMYFVALGVGCVASSEEPVAKQVEALTAAGRASPRPVSPAVFCSVRHPKCPQGQSCERARGEVFGRCVASAAGQLCGPDAIPHDCPSGYDCDSNGGVDVGHCVKAPTQCVSAQGERCGGNTLHPCVCAAGLVCTASGNLPQGDVGGTCERAAGCSSARECLHSNACQQCAPGLGPTCAASDCFQGQCLGIAPCSGAACSADADCTHSTLCALCVQGRGPACTTAQCVQGFCQQIDACSLTL
jgi:hypothetical protein